jgi:hypothetical protein
LRLGSFNYREDAVRHELTANALWNELAKYQTCAEPYDKKDEVKDTSTFMNNVCRLVDSELKSWSIQVNQAPATPAPPPRASAEVRAGAKAAVRPA